MKIELVKYGDLKTGDLFYFPGPDSNAEVFVRTEFGPYIEASRTVARLTPEPPAANEQ